MSGHDEKWVWLVWSQDSKIDFILTARNRWNKLDFLHAVTDLRKAKSCFSDCWVGVIKNGHGILLHETLKSAVS